jgi:hypothetical protein
MDRSGLLACVGLWYFPVPSLVRADLFFQEDPADTVIL